MTATTVEENKVLEIEDASLNIAVTAGVPHDKMCVCIILSFTVSVCVAV